MGLVVHESFGQPLLFGCDPIEIGCCEMARLSTSAIICLVRGRWLLFKLKWEDSGRTEPLSFQEKEKDEVGSHIFALIRGGWGGLVCWKYKPNTTIHPLFFFFFFFFFCKKKTVWERCPMQSRTPSSSRFSSTRVAALWRFFLMIFLLFSYIFSLVLRGEEANVYTGPREIIMWDVLKNCFPAFLFSQERRRRRRRRLFISRYLG